MKCGGILKILFVVVCLAVSSVQFAMAGPLGTAFTYQGRLIDANKAANGLYDFQFKLFDANSAGNELGTDVNLPEVNVINGYFTVELDFGSAFDGNERWLEIGVRAGNLNDPNVYTTLTPRQKVTPAPYAIYAATAGGVSNNNGTLPSGVIVMWSGLIASIPAGWALCDGNNGTLDLRDRFIVGAGSSYSVGDTGGEAFHTLTIDEMPPHTHSYRYWPGWYFSGSSEYGAKGSPDDSHQTGSTGGGKPHENRPPYYALAYIMKL
ncbi:MAG: hypothetical protein WBL85_06265 [Sedimentisphaerales bacterium]